MTGPNVRKRRLGAMLRHLRESSGIDLDELLNELNWSRPKLSRVETAQRGASVADVKLFAQLTEADEPTTERLVMLARTAKQRGWWHSYDDALEPVPYFQDFVELESEASTVTTYEIDLVPGLLQTEGYARGLIAAGLPSLDESEAQRSADLRIARQSRLEHGLSVWAVIDEASLRRLVGGAEVMRRQIDHIIEAAHLPNVTIQVLPLSVGSHVSQGSAFTLLDFETLYDPVVYIDTMTSALYIENLTEVNRYRVASEHLRAIGLSQRDSIAFMHGINKE